LTTTVGNYNLLTGTLNVAEIALLPELDAATPRERAISQGSGIIEGDDRSVITELTHGFHVPA
jgi:hypothetical protein